MAALRRQTDTHTQEKSVEPQQQHLHYPHIMDEEEPTLPVPVEGSEALRPRGAPSDKQNRSTLLETRKKSLLSDDE
jgi:hypothetical protein